MSELKVLVVEDEALIALYIQELLIAAGYQVIGPYASYASAINLGDRPDVALIDYQLADGPNGIMLAHALFDRWQLPVVMATANSAEVLNKRGVFSVLRKPYGDKAVLQAVRAAIKAYPKQSAKTA